MSCVYLLEGNIYTDEGEFLLNKLLKEYLAKLNSIKLKNRIIHFETKQKIADENRSTICANMYPAVGKFYE